MKLNELKELFDRELNSAKEKLEALEEKYDKRKAEKKAREKHR